MAWPGLIKSFIKCQIEALKGQNQNCLGIHINYIANTVYIPPPLCKILSTSPNLWVNPYPAGLCIKYFDLTMDDGVSKTGLFSCLILITKIAISILNYPFLSPSFLSYPYLSLQNFIYPSLFNESINPI